MKNLVIALMAVLISISAASAYNYITEKQTIFYNPQNQSGHLCLKQKTTFRLQIKAL